jgi:hypothetical protein
MTGEVGTARASGSIAYTSWIAPCAIAAGLLGIAANVCLLLFFAVELPHASGDRPWELRLAFGPLSDMMSTAQSLVLVPVVFTITAAVVERSAWVRSWRRGRRS